MPIFRVAKPKAQASLDADVLLPPGQNTIPLNVLDWGEGDHGWNGGDGFTVGRPGLYLCTASLSRAAVATTSGIQVKCLRNGAQVPNTATVLFPSTTTAVTIQVTAWYPCDVGDELQMAGTMHGTLSATARRIGTYFTVCRVGPERWT